MGGVNYIFSQLIALGITGAYNKIIPFLSFNAVKRRFKAKLYAIRKK